MMSNPQQWTKMGNLKYLWEDILQCLDLVDRLKVVLSLKDGHHTKIHQSISTITAQNHPSQRQDGYVFQQLSYLGLWIDGLRDALNYTNYS